MQDIFNHHIHVYFLSLRKLQAYWVDVFWKRLGGGGVGGTCSGGGDPG